MKFLQNWIDGFKPGVEGFGKDPTYAVDPEYQEAAPSSDKMDEALGKDEFSNATVAVKTADGGVAFVPEKTGLKRSLGGRHIQFIALGGSIGTGLFIGSGSNLATGGPGSLMLGFIIASVMIITTVFALGELAAVLPVTGAFSTYSTRFIDPSWGFAMGYNYWLQWLVALPLELTAATIIIQYWDKDIVVPQGVWIAVGLIIMIVINLCGVRGYGEFEFVAAFLKVIGCIGFIICAIVIDCGGTPSGYYMGAQGWHQEGGAFKNGFKGFCSVFITAAFAFSGTELVGLAAAETENPRRQLPKACKQVVFRVLIFYILSLFMITLIVSPNAPELNNSGSGNDPNASPFVIAIKMGAINYLDKIFNAVILISSLSVGNAAIYGASRTLLSLAEQGLAPKIFRYIDREGRPLPAVILSLLFGLLGFLIYSSDPMTVFVRILPNQTGLAARHLGSRCHLHVGVGVYGPHPLPPRVGRPGQPARAAPVGVAARCHWLVRRLDDERARDHRLLLRQCVADRRGRRQRVRPRRRLLREHAFAARLPRLLPRPQAGHTQPLCAPERNRYPHRPPRPGVARGAGAGACRGPREAALPQDYRLLYLSVVDSVPRGRCARPPYPPVVARMPGSHLAFLAAAHRCREMRLSCLVNFFAPRRSARKVRLVTPRLDVQRDAARVLRRPLGRPRLLAVGLMDAADKRTDPSVGSHGAASPSLSPHSQPRAVSSKSDIEAHSQAEEDAILDITEEHNAADQNNTPGLKRALHGRHLRFLALGGGIGTGLFVGTGNILSTGGPGSMIINFILLAIMMVTVIFAIGELVSLFPVAGAYTTMLTRFVDPSLGFAISLNYVLTWLIILPVELTAITIVIGYWVDDDTVPKGVWIAIVLVVVFTINLFGTRTFGEAEFFATTVKMAALVGFIICGIVIVCGGTPSDRYLGAHTWHDPGAFANGFKGFCSVFVYGAFSFGGSELVGLAAAEAAEPRKQLPRACKMVAWRVSIFFVLALFIMSLIVPYNDSHLLGSSSNPRASPFVIAIQIGQIRALPHVFNAAILTSVISMSNSAVYAASRLLVGMAENRHLPAILAYTDRKGRPLPALVVVFLFGLLAFLIYSASEGEIFSWLVGISGLSIIFMWGTICAAHLRFRRAWRLRGHTLRELPWCSPMGVWGSWFGMVLNMLLLAGNFYYSAFPIGEGEMTGQQRAHDFFENMISAVIVLFSFLMHKLITRSHIVRIDEIDLDTDRRDPVSQEVLDRERAEEAAKPMWLRVLNIFI